MVGGVEELAAAQALRHIGGEAPEFVAAVVERPRGRLLQPVIGVRRGRKRADQPALVQQDRAQTVLREIRRQVLRLEQREVELDVVVKQHQIAVPRLLGGIQLHVLGLLNQKRSAEARQPAVVAREGADRTDKVGNVIVLKRVGRDVDIHA